MIRTHKVQLDLTNKQVTFFKKSCGCARLAYNWGLAEHKKRHENGEKFDPWCVIRSFNSLKNTEFKFMYEVASYGQKYALIHLTDAFKRFFKKKAKFPKFKKKGIHDSFTVYGAKFDGKRIKLPVIGWVRMRQELRFTGKIGYVTVSRTADRWFVSVQVEVKDPEVIPARENQAVGVDLGLKDAVVLSTGEKVRGPKALKNRLKRLRRLQKCVSRRQKGSNRRKKAVMDVAKLYYRIANVRKDFWHKLTTDLVRRFNVIGIEDLNVSGMLKNKRLSRSVVDQGFNMFRSFLTYKAEAIGTKLFVADRWYPSSKTCCVCGHVNKELKLKDRSWVCGNCGVLLDRDVNAAKNLASLAVGSTVTVRGEVEATSNLVEA